MPVGAAEDVPVCLVLGTAIVTAIEKEEEECLWAALSVRVNNSARPWQSDTLFPFYESESYIYRRDNLCLTRFLVRSLYYAQGA